MYIKIKLFQNCCWLKIKFIHKLTVSILFINWCLTCHLVVKIRSRLFKIHLKLSFESKTQILHEIYQLGWTINRAPEKSLENRVSIIVQVSL